MGVAVIMIGREGWKAYSSLSDDDKSKVRTLFLTLLKKYTNNHKAIDEEIERGVIFRQKLASTNTIDKLYYLLRDDVYNVWRNLDKAKRKEIEEQLIKKIMELTHDKKIEEYLKKRAEGNGDARFAKKVNKNQVVSEGEIVGA